MGKYFLLAFICSITTASFSQEKKDTLFFRYDEYYLEKYRRSPNLLYPKDIQNDEANLFLFKDEVYLNLDPLVILCLEKFLQSKVFKDGRKKIYFDDLVNYLRGYEIFLVKKEDCHTKYIKVIPGYEIY